MEHNNRFKRSTKRKTFRKVTPWREARAGTEVSGGGYQENQMLLDQLFEYLSSPDGTTMPDIPGFTEEQMEYLRTPDGNKTAQHWAEVFRATFDTLSLAKNEQFDETDLTKLQSAQMVAINALKRRVKLVMDRGE